MEDEEEIIIGDTTDLTPGEIPSQKRKAINIRKCNGSRTYGVHFHASLDERMVMSQVKNACDKLLTSLFSVRKLIGETGPLYNLSLG